MRKQAAKAVAVTPSVNDNGANSDRQVPPRRLEKAVVTVVTVVATGEGNKDKSGL